MPDKIIVHTEQNRLQAIANGSSPENVSVIPHGVEIRKGLPSKLELRTKLNISPLEKVITCFGFVQPHKGMEGLLEGIVHLKERGIAARGFIVGSPNKDDPQSERYYSELKQPAAGLQIADRVTFVTEFVDDAKVGEYLKASDLVLMNYRSQHYESSGACSLAIGAGALVATSIAPPFMAFGDAVWNITSGFPVALTIEALLSNEKLQQTILSNAQSYAVENSWAASRCRLEQLYRQCGLKVTTIPFVEKSVSIAPSVIQKISKPLRVLMQNRPTAYSHRGGDTVLMDHIKRGLEKRGVAVTIDLEGRADPDRKSVV